jgi:crotonobetainyl-CoA:carnitine CoA-transferase CaiB-like acyl-CoA transferase
VIFDGFWDNLLEVIDEPAFRDEKYRTQPARLADKAFIDGRLTEILSTETSEHWLAKLTRKSAFPAPGSIASTRHWPMSRCWRVTWLWN